MLGAEAYQQHAGVAPPGAGDVESGGGGGEEEGVAGVVNYFVREERSEEHGAWISGMYSEMQRFPGFVSRDAVYAPPQNGSIAASLVMRFDNEANLRRWESSQERAEHLNRGRQLKLFDETRCRSGQMQAVAPGDAVSWDAVRMQTSSKPSNPKPPPKWKLAVIISFLVWVAYIPWIYGEFMEILIPKVGVHLAVAIMLFTLVVLVVYGMSEFFIGLPLGCLSLDIWLKQPPLISEPNAQTCCLKVLAWIFCDCLQDGLQCLEPHVPPPPQELLDRVDRAEARLEALKQHQHAVNKAHHGVESLLNSAQDEHPTDGTTSSEAVLKIRQQTAKAVKDAASHSDGFSTDRQSTAIDPQPAGFGPQTDANTALPISVAVHHYIKWECVDEYKDWVELINAKMKTFDGFLSLRTMYPDGTKDDEPHSAIFRFADLTTLHTWMHSQEREQLLLQLNPLLSATDKWTATKGRRLPDLFTDMFASTDGAPLRHPPKWKIVILVTGSLWLVATYNTTPQILLARGNNPYLVWLIAIYMNTFLETYIMTPLLKHVFEQWLVKPRPAYVQSQPWKFFDEGTSKRGGQLMVVLTYAVAASFCALGDLSSVLQI